MGRHRHRDVLDLLALFLAALEAARRVPMTRTFVYTPKCETILMTGPYRVIRHPIYLSYSLAWFAAPVAMHSLLLGVTPAPLNRRSSHANSGLLLTFDKRR